MSLHLVWRWMVAAGVMSFLIFLGFSFRVFTVSEVQDGSFIMTNSINHFLLTHDFLARFSLIALGLILDLFLVCYVGMFLKFRELRLFLQLVFFYFVRSMMIHLTGLPVPSGMIYFYPGFPTISTNYGAVSDFFFSGHSGFALFTWFELRRFGKKWLNVAGFVLVLLVFWLLIVLRIHYTMDVYAGILSAYFFYSVTPKIQNGIKKFLRL